MTLPRRGDGIGSRQALVVANRDMSDFGGSGVDLHGPF